MNSPDMFPPPQRARAYGMTDIGRKRSINQDQFLIAQLNKSMLVTSTSLPLNQESRLFGGVQGQLFLVADGMGGHAAGEKASSLAIDDLVTQLLNRVHWFFQVDHDREEDFVNDLKELLRNTHERILDQAAHHADQFGMGTTLTMAYIVWPRLYVLHAGDSRCYLIRDGECRQLTTDHTMAHRLVEAGGLKPEEEATSKWSNVLWNVLGGHNEEEGLIAEVRRADLLPGDRVLLCSDGLYRYFDCEALAKQVGQNDDLSAVCNRLVELANAAGGDDNITVLLAEPTPPMAQDSETMVQTEIPLGRALADSEALIDDRLDQESDFEFNDRPLTNQDSIDRSSDRDLDDTLPG